MWGQWSWVTPICTGDVKEDFTHVDALQMDLLLTADAAGVEVAAAPPSFLFIESEWLRGLSAFLAGWLTEENPCFD